MALDSCLETAPMESCSQPLLGENDILEDFDFDSFLQNTDDPIFDFGAFLHEYGKDDLDIVGNTVPVTPIHLTRCFHQPPPKMIPIEMEHLQQSCQIIGQNYLQKVITIHNACKKVVGLEYPDILQNQLLTASRTLAKLAELIIEHHSTIVETGVMGALEGLVLECQHACDRLDPGHSLVDSRFLSGDNAVIIGLWKTYIKKSGLVAYDCLVPLSKTLRAFFWFVPHMFIDK
jgi:hypothetical protein